MGDSPQDDAAEQASAPPHGARAREFAPLSGRTDTDPLFVGIGAICDTAARLTGVDGAAVAVLVASHGVRELVYATDPAAQQIDEIQFTVGDGPCLDAYHGDRPELCARVGDTMSCSRWPAFTAEIADLGIAAVFAYPIPGPGQPMGMLELYRRTEGALSEQEHQSALLCATALERTLQSNWAEHLTRNTGEEAAIEAAALSGSGPGPQDPFTRSQVYVAAGMVAVQAKESTADALARLRAYAYAAGKSITAIAADVVARRLTFRHLDDETSVDP